MSAGDQLALPPSLRGLLVETKVPHIYPFLAKGPRTWGTPNTITLQILFPQPGNAHGLVGAGDLGLFYSGCDSYALLR